MHGPHLKEPVPINLQVERFPSRVHGTRSEIELRTRDFRTGPDENTVRNWLILGVGNAGLAFDLVEQILEVDTRSFEAVGIDIREVIRNDVELLVERLHPRSGCL